jgi:hypothetical protein
MENIIKDDPKDICLISVERNTKDMLRRMCQSEGRTYTSMINTLIDCYNYVEGVK